MTCFTEVNHQTRSFNIDFAIANIKYNILGTPFFKKHIQNIDFQQNIMTYTEQHPKFPTKTTFSTFTEKDYPNISYIYTIKCKEPIHFKPRSGKTIHFPIKIYSNLHFEFEDNTKFYPTNPYTFFLQKFKNIFHFLEITHIFLTFILLNVKNQFTLNQVQEKPYISPLKTIQIYILNLKIIQSSTQQTHIHFSYKNSKISFIS